MKGSPIFPGCDNENSNYEFDPQTDFSQFLEEARNYGSHDHQGFPEGESGQKVQKQEVVINKEIKKSKKSWKSVLFPFWRSSSDKKAKQHTKETSKDSHATNPKSRGHVSGPVYGNGEAAAATSGRYRHRLAASGPLTSLFHAKKREENEHQIPYVSLDKLNMCPYDAKAYGPVYLVS